MRGNFGYATTLKQLLQMWFEKGHELTSTKPNKFGLKLAVGPM